MYHTEQDAREAEVTRKQAAREIERHGLNPRDFFAEAGERETYSGAEVLDWLGY